MGIQLACSNGHRLRVKTESAGKKVRCPKCGAVVAVPAGSTESGGFESRAENQHDGGLPQVEPLPRLRTNGISSQRRLAKRHQVAIGIAAGLLLIATVGALMLGSSGTGQSPAASVAHDPSAGERAIGSAGERARTGESSGLAQREQQGAQPVTTLPGAQQPEAGSKPGVANVQGGNAEAAFATAASKSLAQVRANSGANAGPTGPNATLATQTQTATEDARSSAKPVGADSSAPTAPVVPTTVELPNGGRGAGSVPIWNPYRPALDNLPLTIRVLVLNYNPIVAADDHRRLSEVFRWGTPEIMAVQYQEAMEYASGGYLRYEIVEWRNLDEIYAKVDGYRPTIEEYVSNRRKGGGPHWGKHGNADYPRLLYEQNVVPLVDAGLVDEVWIFSDHFFGLWEASMAGPGAFFINGGVYPQVPSRRPFAFYGFNYERAVAEMMHNTSHRTEATMNRAYGPWNLKDPQNHWEKFSANHDQSNGVAGVGTCHWPANATGDYNYDNPREVGSWAEAFLSYPQLEFVRKPVSRTAWSRGGDYHVDYMKWYFAHIPRAAGVNPDGRQNNWFKYIFDFQSYDAKGQPLPAAATLYARDVPDPAAPAHAIEVAYRSARFIDPASLDANDLAVTTPDGQSLSIRLVGGSKPGNRSYRVGRYEVAAPNGGWQKLTGEVTVVLKPDQVRLLDGSTLPGAALGSFRVAPSDGGSIGSERANLLADGSFEIDSSTHWNVHSFRGNKKAFRVVADEVKAGTKALFIATTDEEHAMYKQKVEVKPSTRYQLSGWVKTKDVVVVQKGGRFGSGLGFLGGQASRTLLGNNDWTLLTVDFDSGKRTEVEVWAGLGNYGSTAKGTVWFDDLWLRELSGSALQGVESLALKDSRDALRPGDRGVVRALGKLKAGPEREVTRDVAWSSSDPKVATVDAHGNLRAGQPGEATLSARAGGRVATTKVTVADPGLPKARLARTTEVTGPGTDPLTIVVSYVDADGIRTSSLGLGDIRVTGPNGFQQFPELAGIEDAARSTKRTLPRDLFAVGAVWKGTAQNAQKQSFSVEISVTSRTRNEFVARLFTNGDFVRQIKGTTERGTISWKGINGGGHLHRGRIDGTKMEVTWGPNGAGTGTMSLEWAWSNDALKDAKGELLASYRLMPPAGQWRDADQGLYTVEMKAFQVSDRKGNQAPESALGTFQVRLGTPAVHQK